MKYALTVILIGVVVLARVNLVDNDRLVLREDASPAGVAAVRTAETVGLVRITDKKDFVLWKTGRINGRYDMAVILTPFADGWVRW